MKKQVKFILIFIAISIFELTGCGKSELRDYYVEGSDYQYMLQSTDKFYQEIARGSNGYFFLLGRYISYLDDDTQKLIPLCNKADCLHNKEADETRYKECNAYVNCISSNVKMWGTTGISYCNGYLYYITREFEEDGNFQTLYRMKEDGSEKQVIYRWNGFRLEEWCIHRDVLYFVEHTYENQKDDHGMEQTVEKYAVKQLPLIGAGKKSPQIIYEAPEEYTVYSLSKVKAYGNHVYFVIHAVTLSDTESITDDNYLDYTYFRQLTYDISTGECKALTLPEEEKKGVDLGSVTFWNGKLLIEIFDHNQDLDGISNVYIADLDGSNAKILQKDVVQGERYLSDGSYLYVSNSPLVYKGFEEKQYYKVYDKDMNLVDTLGMPFEGAFDPEIGREEGQYSFFTNDDNTGAVLMYFDKSTIGTYQGAAYSLSKAADWDYGQEDLNELQIE